MATVRTGVMHRREPELDRVGVVEAVDVVLEQSDFALQVLSREVREATVHLQDAQVVVSGGAGIRAKTSSSY